MEGYARRSEEFDAWLPRFHDALQPDDLLIITADHGCDPTTPSTDHSREYVPLLAFESVASTGAVDLGTRATLSDIGQTVADNFGTTIAKGTSFLTPDHMRTPVMAGNWKMYKTARRNPRLF